LDIAQPSLSGPNNLGANALEFYTALTIAGFSDDAFLFYLVGIYNSQVAEDYLEGGGANVLRIHFRCRMSKMERPAV
jgi:hypothetical protein